MKIHYGSYGYRMFGFFIVCHGIAYASTSSFDLISSSDAIDQRGDRAQRFAPSVRCLKGDCPTTTKIVADQASQTEITAMYKIKTILQDQMIQSDEIANSEPKDETSLMKKIVPHLSLAVLLYLLMR